jgi:hypothetical protein
MAATDIIQSYLVSLGFSINQTELNKFTSSLGATGEKVGDAVEGMADKVEKATVGIVGALAAIATAAVEVADKVSKTDLGFVLWAQKMYLGVDAAKKLKIATDALGYSLDEIAWNPELRGRLSALLGTERGLQAGLGPDFEQQMVRLRDLRFEFTRLGVAGEYALQKIVETVTRTFAPQIDAMKDKIAGWAEWIVNNMDKIGEWTEKYLNPILENTFDILKKLWDMSKEVWSDLLNLLAILYQDPKLQGTKENLFERTLQLFKDTSEELDNIINKIKWLENKMHGAMEWLGISPAETPEAQTDQADKIRKLALRISEKTGIPADIVYGDMRHESGNFTNRGARELNNYWGIKNLEGTDYRRFRTPEEGADYWASWINRHGGHGVQTSDELAHVMKRGGYYEDTEANYARGIQAGATHYGDIVVTVNATSPSTADEIADKVARRVKDAQAAQTQRTLSSVSGPYHY